MKIVNAHLTRIVFNDAQLGYIQRFNIENLDTNGSFSLNYRFVRLKSENGKVFTKDMNGDIYTVEENFKGIIRNINTEENEMTIVLQTMVADGERLVELADVSEPISAVC